MDTITNFFGTDISTDVFDVMDTQNRKLRNLLFLYSLTACIHNKTCKEICQRITNKGKSKKPVMITVANKLIKQAFTIAQSGIPYDENYRSVLTPV